jgi:chemotaxis protein methyltransferase CheR
MLSLGSLEFEQIRSLIQTRFGIFISDNKRDMLEAKLSKMLRQLDIPSAAHLANALKNPDSDYWGHLALFVTTNKTSFFREREHFDYLQQNIDHLFKTDAGILKHGVLRAWSAGCSSGEEPYTLAMVLHECLPPGITPRILATDLNNRVLTAAIDGLYPSAIEEDISSYYRVKYFQETEQGYVAKDSLRDMVTFRSFNLMSPFPFSQSLDIVFCRNVMIYFDIPTQERLVHKFTQALAPGGLLFIGLSESLSNKHHTLRYVRPSVYMKVV